MTVEIDMLALCEWKETRDVLCVVIVASGRDACFKDTTVQVIIKLLHNT